MSLKSFIFAGNDSDCFGFSPFLSLLNLLQRVSLSRLPAESRSPAAQGRRHRKVAITAGQLRPVRPSDLGPESLAAASGHPQRASGEPQTSGHSLFVKAGKWAHGWAHGWTHGCSRCCSPQGPEDVCRPNISKWRGDSYNSGSPPEAF